MPKAEDDNSIENDLERARRMLADVVVEHRRRRNRIKFPTLTPEQRAEIVRRLNILAQDPEISPEQRAKYAADVKIFTLLGPKPG